MMRKTTVALVAIPVTMFLLLASCLAVVTASQKATEQNDTCKAASQVTTTVAGTQSPDSLPVSYTGLTVNEGQMSKDQVDIASQITSIVSGRAEILANYKERATIIALITGMVESGLVNVRYGDSDSAGVFQQRPSQGWGTFEEVTNVAYATSKFLDAMLAHPDWKTAEFGEVAADVQRPAPQYRFRYQERVAEAQKIYAALGGVISTVAEVVTCDDNRIEQAVIAALAMVGSPYTGKTDESSFDGVGFVKSAFGSAGIELPASIEDLVQFEGDAATGVAAKFVPAAPGFEPLRGDVLLMSDTGGNEPADATNAGIFVGSSASGSLQIATYNLKTGDGFPARIQRAKELATELEWDVIGFQEAEREPLFSALKSAFTDQRWKIYPDNPGRVYRNGLNARAIAYNASRFELVATDQILFERMKQDGDPQPAQAPVIRLRDKETSQEFYVVNTHSSAFERYALERKQAGQAYVQKVQELKATGLPVLFTGDFNSGYWMTNSVNTTWQNDRNNLAYCQLTKDGLMQNARDVEQGIAERNGGYCPRQPGEGPNIVDHIYVTPGVEVTDFETVERARTLSDHDALYARVTLPAMEGADTTPNGGPKGLGTYIGPDPETGVISMLPVPKNKLVGVLRLTITQANANAVVDGEWTLPIKKEQYRLTARFGEVGPFWTTTHTGLDFSATRGTQIYAVTAGSIVSAGWAGPYGNQIIIRSPNGLEVWYNHLDSIDVTSGDVVTGAAIGKVGATGNVSGYHLHLEVRPNDEPIDPYEFLRMQGLNP